MLIDQRSTLNFATRGVTEREIRTLNDFNPSGGIITLQAGLYQIKDTINIGSNRFVFEPGDPFVLMEFEDSFNHYIEHNGNNMTLISGRGGIRLLDGKGFAFVINGDNVKLIDIVGSFGMEFSFVGFYGSGCSIGNVSGKIINESATAGFILNNCIIDGWCDGVNVTNAIETSINNVTSTSSSAASGSLINIKGSGTLDIFHNSNITIQNASASLMNIDPTVKIPVSINTFFVYENGYFFEPSTKSGNFTAVADASIGSTSITSVTDSSGVARFNFTGPTLYVYQEVVISGFVTNASEYNGTWIITDTDGTSWFEINTIDFGSSEITGSFYSNSVTLTENATSAADGDSILIDTDYSTDYDTGSYVYNQQTNNFQINAVWTTTASGSWRNGSQTEKEKYITVRDCGEQQDSKYLSSIYVSNNTNTTSVTAGTWGDLNLGTLTDSDSSSRFKLINPSNGEIEYTGLNPFDGVLRSSISAKRGSATKVTHQFRAYKSVGTPAFEGIITEVGLTNELVNFSLISPVSLDPGDRFKLQITSVGTDTTVTAQNIVISVN